MKYIKAFENIIKTIYYKDDYVLLSNVSECLLPYAKIIKRHKYKTGNYPIDRYLVEILFPNTNHWKYNMNDDIHDTFIEDYLIVRKLTRKEKEELKLKLKISKYNL